VNASPPDISRQSRVRRLFTRRVGGMLVRNTVVSTGVFLLGLVVLWVLVQQAGMDEVPAAGIGFMVAQTLHYALGRSWIFRGTDRPVASGYVIFLLNAGLGLTITMVTFAALLRFTSMHYLVARVAVSVLAGLAMFVINAQFNFRRV
jgi:putative flippase GtrA